MKKYKTLFEVIYIILVLILKGFVLAQLWNWFISPTFEIPDLTFPIGIGIASMFFLVSHLPIWHFENYEEEFNYHITIGVKPLVVLAIGWVVHLFM